MIRDYQESDNDFICKSTLICTDKLPGSDPKDLVRIFISDKAVSKREEPDRFCCLRHSFVPPLYAPFFGMATKVSFLIGDYDHPETMLPILAQTLFEIGEKIPEARNRPIYTRTKPPVAQYFKEKFDARISPLFPRLVWLPKLQTAIDRSKKWRT